MYSELTNTMIFTLEKRDPAARLKRLRRRNRDQEKDSSKVLKVLSTDWLSVQDTYICLIKQNEI